MIRSFLYVLLAVILSSCASAVAPVAYQCPTVVLPPDPKNMTVALTPQSTPDEVMKAWVATAVGYHDWNKIVRNQMLALQKQNATGNR